jgi:hypothetical protein
VRRKSIISRKRGGKAISEVKEICSAGKSSKYREKVRKVLSEVK